MLMPMLEHFVEGYRTLFNPRVDGDIVPQPVVVLYQAPIEVIRVNSASLGAELLPAVQGKRYRIRYIWLAARNTGTDTGTFARVYATVGYATVYPLYLPLVPSAANAVSGGGPCDVLVDENQSVGILATNVGVVNVYIEAELVPGR